MAELSASVPDRRLRIPIWAPLLVLVATISGLLVLAGEPLAGAVVLGTPALPFLYYGLAKGVAGERNFGSLLAAGIIFVLSANFRYREITEKSIDFQVALKLLAIGASLGFTVLFLKPIVRQLYLYGLAYWLAFYGWLLFSATYAMAPLTAGVSTISLIGSFLFLCFLCVKYGPDRMVEILVWAGLVMCVASIAVYFAVPEFGRMKDWYGTEQILTSRMQGLFGASNGAGCGAATLLFLTIFFYMKQPGASRLIGWATILTSSITMIMSINRMAIGAFLLCCLIYFLVTGNFGRKLLLLFAVGVLAAVPVLLFPEAVFELVSRSGDAEEITSGTGRTRIWAVVLDLVPKSWLFGYGYASAQHILPIHPDLFEAAAHCHNLYLEMLFCSGVIGLFFLAWCILTTIILAIRVGGARELGLFFFFLPYGLTEPVIGGVTYFAMIIWQASVVLLFYRAKLVEVAAGQSDRFSPASRGT
ncbi:MAG: O-antigen ligase family protein [Hyphomicrobiaceae bacterium]